MLADLFLIIMLAHIFRHSALPKANALASCLFSFAKPHKKHREKFHLDYEYFSNIPLGMRDDELERIVSLPKSNLQLAKDIPFFPNCEYWDYHGVKLMTHTW